MSALQAAKLRDRWWDATAIADKDFRVCRRLIWYLLPLLTTPAMILLFQVAIMFYLSNKGQDGVVMASVLVDSFKHGVSTSLGMFVILGTSIPLSAVLAGRDRYAGSLEGILSTPVSTFGVWLGRTLAAWVPGAIMFLLSLLIVVSGLAFLFRDLGGFAHADLIAMAESVPPLLVMTFLSVGLVVMVQFSGSRWVSVFWIIGTMMVLIVLLPFLGTRMLQGKYIDHTLFARVELAAIPVLLVLNSVLGRFLLRRERLAEKLG